MFSTTRIAALRYARVAGLNVLGTTGLEVRRPAVMGSVQCSRCGVSAGCGEVVDFVDVLKLPIGWSLFRYGRRIQGQRHVVERVSCQSCAPYFKRRFSLDLLSDPKGD